MLLTYFLDSTDFQEKSLFSKNKELQNLNHEHGHRLFYLKTILIRHFGYLCKDSKRNWVSASLSSETYVYETGLTLAPMKNNRWNVSLNIFAVCIQQIDEKSK